MNPDKVGLFMAERNLWRTRTITLDSLGVSMDRKTNPWMEALLVLLAMAIAYVLLVGAPR